MNGYFNQLEYFWGNFTYIEGKPENIKNALINKLFKNNRSLEDLLDFVEDKQNLILDKEYTIKSFKNMLQNDTDAVTLYDKNNILVIKIEEPEDMKKIGDISLWCFTYDSGNDHNFYEFSTNGIVYVIVDFNVKQTDNDFMLCLIKELNYDSDWQECEYEDEDNGFKLFDILNQNIDNPILVLDKLIGVETCEKLFTFEY
jgi:hypothetical protein